MKPICVPCQLFYRPKKNGFSYVEGMPVGNGAGTNAFTKWAPYKLWQGDLWECRGCGAEIIVGTGRDHIAEHFQTDFADKVKKFGATLQINDC